MPEREYTDFADFAELVKLFPTLRRGITVHNPSELLSSLWEPSGGARHAAACVIRAHMGHGAEARYGLDPFDVFAAWDSWDSEQRAGFLELLARR